MQTSSYFNSKTKRLAIWWRRSRYDLSWMLGEDRITEGGFVYGNCMGHD